MSVIIGNWKRCHSFGHCESIDLSRGTREIVSRCYTHTAFNAVINCDVYSGVLMTEYSMLYRGTVDTVDRHAHADTHTHTQAHSCGVWSLPISSQFPTSTL